MFQYRMRYMRKLIGVGVLSLILLWLFVGSLYDVKSVENDRPKITIKQLEDKINDLEKLMDNEFKDSSKLLAKVKKQLHKTDNHIENSDKHNSQNAESGAAQEVEQVSSTGPILPVLVIACDRISVRRCLDNLVKFRPNKETFPIIVSQDCDHAQTYNVIRSFVDSDPSISVVKQPDQSEIRVKKSLAKFVGYHKIARHYRFALNYVFDTMGYEAVIVVEDDLDISPDFFEYFLGTYPLLLKDPSLWCVSAWNDNGKRSVIDMSRPELLHRSDFFPGLGWSLRRGTWRALEPHWPDAFWDDWLRDPKNTDNKACIRPEISRTYTFGKVGVSKGLYFENHLRHMQLNMDFVEFTKLNLTYLLKENYDPWLLSQVSNLPSMTAEEALTATEPVKVPYRTAKQFKQAAKRLGLMDDLRSGIPRTAYLGIVSCYVNDHRVYITPDFDWVKYDPTWD